VKHWHFSDVVKTTGVSENISGKWLRQFQKDGLIKRVKPKGKMPYFTGNYDNPQFIGRKKLYAMQKLYDTGLIQKLQKLRDAKAIILFGSYVRTDWNSESDVDVFVYGDSGRFKNDRLWGGLGFLGKSRTVQVHTFNTKKEMREVKSGLFKNIIRGYVVKGDIFDILEEAR